MEHLDYERTLRQLREINSVLKQTNRELRKQCSDLERRFGAIHYRFYNQYVNGRLFGALHHVRRKAHSLLGHLRKGS